MEHTAPSSAGDAQVAPRLRGHLVVFVDGYLVDDFRCVDHNFPLEYPWEKGWITGWGGGWAFGDNPRNRYCSRMSDKIKRFDDYDQAVSAIHLQQKRRKRFKESYQLVYRWSAGERVVSSLDEVLEIDAHIAREEAEAEQARQEDRARFDRKYPKRDLLIEAYGMSAGMRLAAFLGALQRVGLSEAMAEEGLSRATGYRYKKLLLDAGIELPSGG